MGRRRLVNSRSRRLEATHWRRSKYAANFTDGPADVGLEEEVTGKEDVYSSGCILSPLRRQIANGITKTKHRETQHIAIDMISKHCGIFHNYTCSI
jgi:hypothetical protein